MTMLTKEEKIETINEVEKYLHDVPLNSNLYERIEKLKQWLSELESEVWLSVDEKLPPTKWQWSELDYLVCATHYYTIGRTLDGKWVDMNNKPIENVTHYKAILPPIQAPVK